MVANLLTLGSGEVSMEEFQTLGFLFNFTAVAIRKIYEDFSISGRKELTQDDFQLFVLAAVEAQGTLDLGEGDWRNRLHELVEGMRRIVGFPN